MADNSKKLIFVVDDDSCICDTVSVILKQANLRCVCFSNAEDCLEELRSLNCDLLITDVQMAGKDGIELLGEVKHIMPWLPVIIMTSYGDISMSVKAVKAGAFDFIEKPFGCQRLLGTVEKSLKHNNLTNLLRGKSLTKTEMINLRLLLEGRSNKEIAHILHRSIRTIEDHRGHIMHKLDVNNIVELVTRAAALGLLDGQARE